jgi:hypothetical protein
VAVGDIVPVAGGQFEDTLASASPDLLREMIKGFAQRMMDAEVEALCGAGYGEVSAERVNSRNGYRRRQWDTRAGTMELAIPKLRQGSYYPEWLLERRRRAERALATVVATSYLLGVSTRRMEKHGELVLALEETLKVAFVDEVLEVPPLRLGVEVLTFVQAAGGGGKYVALRAEGDYRNRAVVVEPGDTLRLQSDTPTEGFLRFRRRYPPHGFDRQRHRQRLRSQPRCVQPAGLSCQCVQCPLDRHGRSTDMVSRHSPRRQAVTQSEDWKPPLVSLLDGIPRALELATAWKGDGRRSCGQAAEATHIRSGHSFPALTADRGAVAVTEFDDSPSAGGDQQARRRRRTAG